MRKATKIILFALGGVVLVALVVLYYGYAQLQPLSPGAKRYVRFEPAKPLPAVLGYLQDKGIVRNAKVAHLYAKLTKQGMPIQRGTYQLAPGMTVDQVLSALKTPIRNFFRIPETNLSYRTAKLLSKNEIASEEEYNRLLKTPSEFQPGFQLPQDTLEGYLYPDTYDLPPLLGAKNVMKMQLAAFQKKVLPLLPKVSKRRPILTIASMVELEAGVDEERAKIAGVIYNRLKKGMKLEIDATLLYALGEWRRLTYADYRNVDSPYSTYKHKGLPPGPICSPSLKSVQAALKPESHPYLYYVALPNRHHLFSRTYDEHLSNIKIARKARAAAQN